MSVAETLFSYKGRLRVRTYFGYSAAIMVLVTALSAAIGALAVTTMATLNEGTVIALWVVSVVPFGGLLYVSSALLVKRLHDFGYSGYHAIWIMLLSYAFGMIPASAPPFVTVLGLLLALALWGWVTFKEGQEGPNQFGPDPRANDTVPAAGPAAGAWASEQTDPPVAAPASPRVSEPPPRAAYTPSESFGERSAARPQATELGTLRRSASPDTLSPASAAGARAGLVAKLFSFRGRIARLPYLGYSTLLSVFGYAGLLGAVFGFMSFDEGRGAGYALLGIAGIALLGASVFLGVALMVRRLHDMDLRGPHAIWVWLIYLVSGGGGQSVAAQGAAVVLGALAFGVSVWLLFTRGTDGANRFGPQPGAPTDPAILLDEAVTFATTASSVEALRRYWIDNEATLNDLAASNPAGYARVRDAFGQRERVLNQPWGATAA